MTRRRHAQLTAAVATATICGLALPAIGEAHNGSPNFRSTLREVTPSAPGVRMQVLNYDDRLQLINRSGKTVVVGGYDGEPYIRLLADGSVAVNRNSPALYLNEDRYGDVSVPPSARKDAAPVWKEISRTGRYEWHDHRIHYMAKGTPPQVKDRNERTKIFAWRVPIQVGDRPVQLRGDLFWQPQGGGLPRGALLGLAALVFGGIAFVEVVRRRRRRVEARRRGARTAWG